MENIIFAALMYILVPAFLLWMNHEPATVNQLLNPQLKNNIRITDLSHPSITSQNIKPVKKESDLLNYKRIEAKLHHTNPTQKRSENKVQPTIQKIESEETPLDYHQLTIRQLKKIAQKKKIKRYGNMRKADLILALTS